MHDVTTHNPRQEPAADPMTGTPPEERPEARHRRHGLQFGLGTVLLLAGGLAFGESRSYSQNREVMATAEQEPQASEHAGRCSKTRQQPHKGPGSAGNGKNDGIRVSGRTPARTVTAKRPAAA